MKKKQPPAKKPKKKSVAVIAGPEKDPQAIRLPLSLIKQKGNVREKLEGIEALAQSIKSHGLLQPLIVSKREGKFVLIAGARRYAALELLKETHASVQFRTTTEKEAKTVQLIENIQRQELTGKEEVLGVAELLPAFGGNQSALGQSIGREKSYVSRCIRAASFLKQMPVATSQLELSKSLLFQLADAEDPKKLWEQVQAGNVKTVKEAREKSGPVAGGRFGAEKAVQFRAIGDSGRFVFKVAFCPERTPQNTKTEILKMLRELIAKLEQSQQGAKEAEAANGN